MAAIPPSKYRKYFWRAHFIFDFVAVVIICTMYIKNDYLRDQNKVV
jgi:hypothetical protein